MAPSPVGRYFFAPLLLIAVVLFTFSPVLENEFVSYDDPQEIVRNPDLNPPTLEKLKWNWTHTRMSLYMPLTYYVWGAVAAIAPPKPLLPSTSFHALNLSLHALSTLLIYALILRLWKRAIPALMAALVFATHPLQTEAIAWASGMYTLLSCALCLASMLIHTVAVQSSTTPRPSLQSSKLNVGRWTFALHCAATILYLLALLTKPASISVPLMIAVIDLLILKRSTRQTIIHAIFWLILGLPVVLLARHFQDVSSLQQSPLWSRPLVALDAIGFYLRKLLLPIRLTPDYGRTPGWVLVHLPQMAVSILIASCTLLAAWLGRNRARWITASICLLLAGMLPYLGLAQFDFQHISTVADRYAYLGMIGVAMFAAGIAMRSRLATIGLLIICGIWAVLSQEQATRWRDDATLFTYALQVNPDSLLAHSAIGYRAANQIPPNDSSAEFNYKAALRVWPQDAEVLFNLGNLYLRHDPAAAVEQYQRAIANQPRMPEYHNNLAVAFAKLGQFQNACDQWQRAIDLAPNYVDPHNNRGDLYRRMNQRAAAIADYRAVLQIDPNNEHAAAMLVAMGAKR